MAKWNILEIEEEVKDAIEELDSDNTSELDESDSEAGDGEDTETGEETEDDIEEETEEAEDEPVDALPKGSKSAERLAELAAAVKEATNAATSNRRQVEELRSELAERAKASEAQAELAVRKTSLDEQRRSLESKVLSAQRNFLQAKEDSDPKAELKAVEELSRARLELLANESEIDTVKEKAEEIAKAPKAKTKDPGAEDNAEALAFINRNEWIRESPVYVQRLVATAADTLMAKDPKLDVNSTDFYDKLEKVLSGVLKANELDYKVVPRVADSKKSGEVVAKKKSGNPSRESASESNIQGKSAEGKIRVKVTEEDRRMADVFQLPIREYMLEKVKLEKQNKDRVKGGGTQWTTIL